MWQYHYAYMKVIDYVESWRVFPFYRTLIKTIIDEYFSDDKWPYYRTFIVRTTKERNLNDNAYHLQ